ncbi:MAG: tRNA lysidine(34) synthetase TilS [Blautia sp.]|nr:tRNA lysidine(34) synthetase TilS [Blautia sp.]
MEGESLRERMYRDIEEYEMIRRGDHVTAGVSGGLDSVVMLHMLQGLSVRLGFTLSVLHVNHGIRGREAEDDETFVRKLCEAWQIPCRIRRFSVPEIAAREGIGLEEAGRNVRKQAFEEEKQRIQKPGTGYHTALAHNRNDLAETVLHHLGRGTGLQGLCSMRSVDGDVIRPVLKFTRDELAEYQRDCGLSFVTDSTNGSDDYTRNRIRHQLIPVYCRSVNARAVEHIAETSGILSEASDFLLRRGRMVLESCGREDDGFLLGEAFTTADPAEQSSALMLAMKELSGRQQDFTRRHVDEIRKLLKNQPGRFADLPYGLRAERVYEGIRLWRTEISGEKDRMEPEPFMARFRKEELLTAGQMTIGEWHFRLFPYQGQKIVEKRYTKWLDYDTIENSLEIRCRRADDHMVISADGRQKSLSRVMIDDKIPRRFRDTIPVLASGDEVLWIAGGRLGLTGRINAATRRVLEISFGE